MAELETARKEQSINELLRHSDDLDKIATLKSHYLRQKANIDAELKKGVKQQLDVTKSGMDAMNEGVRTISSIKEEMLKIERLCSEASRMIEDFPLINEISKIHRNFISVQEMMFGLQRLPHRIDEVLDMLDRDGSDISGPMPNMLSIHFNICQLRDFRDLALQEAQSSDQDTRRTLEQYFLRLDEMFEVFEDRLFHIANNLIIEAEERVDQKVVALQDAQTQHTRLAAKFKSIKLGNKSLRGYKSRVDECIRKTAELQFSEAEKQILENLETFPQSLEFVFEDLAVVQSRIEALVPKKWALSRFYVETYHENLRGVCQRVLDADPTDPQAILSVLQWNSLYHSKLKELGIRKSSLPSPLITEQSLVNDFVALSVENLEKWAERIISEDSRDYRARSFKPETDESGHLVTTSPVTFFQMVNQQIYVAEESNRQDVLAGLLEEIGRVLRERQAQLEGLLQEQISNQIRNPNESPPGILEWTIALANDQISCANYMEAISDKIAPALSEKFSAAVSGSIELAINGFLDVSKSCLSCITDLVFNDLKAPYSVIFRDSWYGSQEMGRITETIKEYLSDCRAGLDESLYPVLVEEMSETTIIRYLSAVRNKGARLKTDGSAVAQIREDVQVGFGFFGEAMDTEDAKRQWYVLQQFISIVNARTDTMSNEFISFKTDYPDLSLEWVEVVLKARDDYTKELLESVRKSNGEISGTLLGSSTMMSKVK